MASDQHCPGCGNTDPRASRCIYCDRAPWTAPGSASPPERGAAGCYDCHDNLAIKNTAVRARDAALAALASAEARAEAAERENADYYAMLEGHPISRYDGTWMSGGHAPSSQPPPPERASTPALCCDECNQVTTVCEHLDDRVRAMEAAESALSALREGVAKLIAKLDEVHASSAYQLVWTIAQMRLGQYAGPNYVTELDALRALLGGGDAEKENER